ncbi:non-ribosomal peptide synthetase [Nostocales cyanobacterium HT-58-2]|nr:non-ribosomal peptide synthetase [Nostocales cyanobacterium HT-58-2]
MQQQIQGFPLSPQQRHLWLLQQDSQSYLACCAILLEGNLQVEVLKAALHQVVNRHEILRTTFQRTHGTKIPIQRIRSCSAISLHEHTLENEDSSQAIDIIFQNTRQVYNFDKDAILQTSLIHLSYKKYVLIIHLPSLCADTKTLKNLVCEISRCYAACLQGEELTDEPLQYTNLAEWQNELIEAEDTKVGREYWQKQDFSALKTLKLPFENWSSEKLAFAPQYMTLPIHPDVVAQLEASAHNHQTSVSHFLLACWQILLWRLTAQSDIITGMACNGRKYEELQTAIGLLTKYVPLRCRLQPNDQFSDVLAQVDASASNAYAKQEYFAWEQIVGVTGNSLEPSFFPFCFEFENTDAKYVAGDVSFSIYHQYACIDRFKVKLSCIRSDSFLNAEFHYDANLFLTSDIKRLAEEFETLLTSAIDLWAAPSGSIAHPQAEISKLEIVSARKKQQLLVEFNQTQTVYPEDQCIHHLFEAQVERTPDNVAVMFENQQLTYAELNARVNQLAHGLQQLGVGPEVLVGLYMERSIEMVVGLLAILKAGGAYVPLDPTYPKERLTFILEDTQTPILLTQKHLAAELPTEKIKVVCLDTDWEIIAYEQVENPVSNTTVENLAYVIYTSGSTGKPKGTLIHHKGLVNYLRWCTQAYSVEQGEGTLVHSSIAFDLTITGLFSPLLVGRKVELLPQNLDLEALAAALRNKSNYSLVKITPAQLELLTQQLSPQEAAGKTRAFIIGGENLLAESLAFWQTNAPDTILINEYGPTETVVGCCVYQVPQSQKLSGSVPIGRPIANTQLYLLDEHQQLVPIGVPGELHIGGAGLARGYLNQPELTALKFIPNPFTKESGARLYKTGDLARYRPDGTLEFLGRIDHQVKIRGFRIELGEIEGVLLGHPDVQESVAIAREDRPGDKRLVAYVVPSGAKTHSALINDLRSFLKQKLPEYMVPRAFVLLKTLPLTSNGKIDRRSLPEPTNFEREETFVAPQTEIEQTLATLWQEVLRVEKVGIYDNFFDLGGHSLLIVQVHRKLHELVNTKISMVEMFQYPTINALAKYLTQETLTQETDDESSFGPSQDLVKTRRQSRKQQRQLRQEHRAMNNQQEICNE